MSKHFNTSIDKLLVTVEHPTVEQLQRLEYTLNELELPRNHFNFSFVITSGLRPPKKKYSQHQDGYAADFVPVRDIGVVFEWMCKFCQYDQIILETKSVIRKGRKVTYKWIHLSLKKSNNRHEALVATIVVVDGKETTTYERYELHK